MVTGRTQPGDESFEELQERWPQERPSKRHPKRAYRRKSNRQVVIRAERLPEPSTTRMSKALLAAQRELSRLEAERDARNEVDHHA